MLYKLLYTLSILHFLSVVGEMEVGFMLRWMFYNIISPNSNGVAVKKKYIFMLRLKSKQIALFFYLLHNFLKPSRSGIKMMILFMNVTNYNNCIVFLEQQHWCLNCKVPTQSDGSNLACNSTILSMSFIRIHQIQHIPSHEFIKFLHMNITALPPSYAAMKNCRSRMIFTCCLMVIRLLEGVITTAGFEGLGWGHDLSKIRLAELSRTPSRVSSIFSRTKDKCTVCSKTAYPLVEIYVEVSDYHMNCFKCSHGDCILIPSSYAA